MAFEIRVVDFHGERSPGFGEITLGEDVERFKVSFVYWNKRDYEVQWIEALTVASQERRNAFLYTSVQSTESGKLNFAWLCFPKTSGVAFQEALVKAEWMKLPTASQYALLGDYTAETDCGSPISEWLVSYDDINKWLGAAMSPSALH